MKKFLIPVLSIMLLLPFMYGGCLSTDDVAELIDGLPSGIPTGTWVGPGEISTGALPGQGTALRAASGVSMLATLRVTVSESADVSVTINGLPVSDWAGTDVTGTVDIVDKNIITMTFSNGWTGGLVYEDTLTYGVFFIRDQNPEANYPDVAEGVLQINGPPLPTPFTGSHLVGTPWAGFSADFCDYGFDGINPTGVILTTVESSLSPYGSVDITSGSSPDGTIFGTYLAFEMMEDADFGHYIGNIDLGNEQFIGIDGFLSPDTLFAGGFVDLGPDLDRGCWEWSIIALKK